MNKLALVVLVLLTSMVSAQSDMAAIEQTLMNYINGSSYNDMEQIQSAFYEQADLFLTKKDQEIWVVNPKEYAELFQKRTKGEFNGRQGTILTIDVANTIATAKVELRIPASDLLYVDLFLLKKISGKWKIISKAATQIQ